MSGGCSGGSERPSRQGMLVLLGGLQQSEGFLGEVGAIVEVAGRWEAVLPLLQAVAGGHGGRLRRGPLLLLERPVVLLLELLVGAGEHVEDGSGREGHDQYPAQDAAQRHHLAREAARHHVPVAHRRHGDDGPPVGGRDAAEVVRAGRQLALGQVHQRGEERDGHAEEEQEQAKLPHAPAHRQAQRLQAQRVAGQPHHVQDAERAHDAQHQAQFVQVALAPAGPLVLRGGALVLVLHQQGHVVGQDGHGVDDVEGPAGEGQLAARLQEAQQELQGEPGHAHRLHYEHVVALLRALALRRQREREREKGRQEEWEGGSETQREKEHISNWHFMSIKQRNLNLRKREEGIRRERDRKKGKRMRERGREKRKVKERKREKRRKQESETEKGSENER
ncbi:hypothetical protein SKAU_G00388660 [Synaphobranchus kaupii]|uniref:Uncharacterized protein n=1 Tax=Synaphobranchus kaupii TaxID=118154 RepID=A0A9Q1EB14_SYNKA|nr:hypothetical protein SKAU_G00388660 [Synaphobranchus kaupii]